MVRSSTLGLLAAVWIMDACHGAEALTGTSRSGTAGAAGTAVTDSGGTGGGGASGGGGVAAAGSAGSVGGATAGAAGAAGSAAGGAAGEGGGGSTGGGAGGVGGTVAPLPFAVDDLYFANGYMGDGVVAGGITDVSACPVARQGDGRGRCHRFVWTPGPMGWAGVFWQYPNGNWGATPGLEIAAGASQVTFYAWGASGDETVGFFAGMSVADGFSVRNPDLILTTTPTRYAMDLTGVIYTRVVGGFGWAAGGAGLTTPVTFYVDDIEWR